MCFFKKNHNKSQAEQAEEEFKFLDCEVEDNDDDAPLGTLLKEEPKVEEEKQPDKLTTEAVEEKAEEPVAEEPAVDEPVAEEPVAEEPVAEEPVAEEPVAEEPVAEEPVAEEPVAEEPVVEEPVAEEPVAEEPVAEEPVVDEPVAEEPVAEEPVVDEPVAEEPVAEEPVAEEPASVSVLSVPPTPIAEEEVKITFDTSENVISEDKKDEVNLGGASFEVPQEKPQKSAPKKKVNEDDIWGRVAFAPKKDEKKDEEPAPTPVKKTRKAKSVVEQEKSDNAPVATTAPEKPLDKKSTVKKSTSKSASTAKIAAADVDNTSNTTPEKTEDKKMADKKYTIKLNEGETAIDEGDVTIPHGRFTIRKTDKGNFVFKLFSYNHRTVAIGAEAYSSLAGCKGGIASVRKNAATAPIEDQTLKNWVEIKCPKWQIYPDKKGEIRLRLISSNGNIVATTNDGYLSKSSAKQGIDAISRACEGSEITRWDDMD